ncbi:MAG: AAA family ATPase [Candidatus Limnocylindrales bacterium]
MAGRFVDRTIEQRTLSEAWESGRPELVVLHGRRRVGKTELLVRFAARRPVAFFVAAQQQAANQLADLGRVLGGLSAGPRTSAPPRLALRDWGEALDVLAEASRRRRVGLVLDEFPYLCEADPALPSVLQRWWDRVGSQRDLVLVLSGSEQAMMRRLTSEEGALYGRPTRSIWLRPFDYYWAGRFLGGWTPEDRVRAFAIAGGIPDYLEEFDTRRSLREELARLAFLPEGRLFREAPDLLRAEFNEPRTYESILRAMAAREQQPSRIAALAGLKGAAAAAPYLERLIRLELVERRTLPTEASNPRPRISRYVVLDPYLRFYFALVDPWRSAIQLGQGPRVLDELWPVALDEHVSRVFEDVAAQYVRRLSGAGMLPVLEAVGQHWLEAGDVDVVGVAGGRVRVAGSAKWTRAFVKPGDLADLRRDAALIAGQAEPELLLFARSGFDPALRSVPGVRLVRPADLFRAELDFERAPARPGRD